jgi:hypothetical protein
MDLRGLSSSLVTVSRVKIEGTAIAAFLDANREFRLGEAMSHPV